MAIRLNKIRHKYSAKRTELDGIKFASKKEARRYEELKLLQISGDVVFFLRQVPLFLPGGIKHVIDYLIFWSSGTVTFEDVKGYDTPQGKMKRTMVEAIYPIKIELT